MHTEIQSSDEYYFFNEIMSRIHDIPQVVLDSFLRRDLYFPTMIDGKVETKMLPRPAQPKTKFLFLANKKSTEYRRGDRRKIDNIPGIKTGCFWFFHRLEYPQH
jgi:hypothetical protein